MIFSIANLYPEIVFGATSTATLLLYIALRYPIYNISRHSVCTKADNDGLAAANIPLSVVVVAHDQGAVLERNLEAIALQNYNNFEIVVVNDDSSDNTADVITRIERRYPNVRHTFTPHTARCVSHSKLSITLGIRAAHHDWIVLTEGDCRPMTKEWLSTMAKRFNDNIDFVLGYANYVNDLTLRTSRYRLDRIIHALRHFHAAVPAFKRGKAVGGDNSNIAFRKSLFLENKGFSGQLSLLGGENLLFVDRVARKGRTAVCAAVEAKMLQTMPALNETLKISKMIQTEASRKLGCYGKLERCKWASGSICAYLAGLSVVALTSCLCMKQEYIVVACYLAFFLLLTGIGNLLFNRSAHSLGEGGFYFLFPIYELTQPLFNIVYKISSMRHRRDLMRKL